MRYKISEEVLASDGLILVRPRDSVAVVTLVKRSLHEQHLPEIEARLVALADAVQGRIALSLAGVEDLASAGINALIRVHLRCKQLGGMLACFAADEHTRQVFRVTHLDQRLPLTGDVEQACNLINRKPPGTWLGRLLGRRPAAA